MNFLWKRSQIPPSVADHGLLKIFKMTDEDDVYFYLCNNNNISYLSAPSCTNLNLRAAIWTNCLQTVASCTCLQHPAPTFSNLH